MDQELNKLVFDLISFKTQNQDYDQISDCFNYIIDYFNGTDYDCDLIEVNKVKSLFVHKNKSGNLDCIFNGHIDVVPAQENQFCAYINNNMIYGRGAIDMKSQVATFIYFIKHYIGNKNIGALITSDEEIGGFNGTPKALEKFNINAKVAIVPDGGYNYQLINSERGVLQLNIDVFGKSVHSSKEPEGINALTRAMDIYYNIKNYLSSTSPDCQTVNLARLSTDNEVYNKVPDQANMLIDIRYSSQSDIGYVYKFLDNCENLKYFVYAKASPFYIDINNEIVKKYISICKDVLSKDIEILECPAASDARFFSEKNIPAIMMNPEGQEMHGNNEAININSFENVLKIYEKFMEVL